MKHRRGALIWPTDFDSYWVEMASRASLNVLALHPIPELEAAHPDSAETMLANLTSDRFRRTAGELAAERIDLEFEIHAMHLLLPRSHFDSHPEWFRLDESGVRTPDRNYCPSQEEPSRIVEQGAARLVEQLAPFTPSHRYFLWIDDNAKYCHCEQCRQLSPSDQALIIHNAIMRGVRRADPEGTSAYLAYQNTIPVPTKVKPEAGLFLEYAPINRDSGFAMDDQTCAKNVAEAAHIPSLLAFFGTAGSQVIEYWLDVSRFYRWRPPYGELPYYPGVLRRDVEFYRGFGFETQTSFALGLNRAYEANYGEPPVVEYGQILHGRRTA
jgi:hypothetical protein